MTAFYGALPLSYRGCMCVLCVLFWTVFPSPPGVEPGTVGFMVSEMSDRGRAARPAARSAHLAEGECILRI